MVAREGIFNNTYQAATRRDVHGWMDGEASRQTGGANYRHQSQAQQKTTDPPTDGGLVGAQVQEQEEKN